MRRWHRSIVTAVLATGLALSASAAVAAPPTGLPPVYLALGDSIAAGVGADDPETTGYVSLLGGILRSEASCGPGHSGQGTGRNDGCESLQTKNLSFGGATTATLISQQLGPAVDLLQARNQNGSPRDDVRFVTVTIGGNDLFTPVVTACTQSSPQVCQDTIVRLLAVYETNLDQILRELRAAAGQHAVIVATAYNNPLPACFLAPLEDLADMVLEGGSPPGLNVRTKAVAARYDVHVANAFDRLGPAELVGGSDCLHPNQAGHQIYARIFADTILTRNTPR